jgi:hypothetical protein
MAQPISALLHKADDRLGSVVSRFELVKALNDTLKDSISTSFVQYCRVINVHKSSLVVQSPSPGITNKLRYFSTEIVSYYRQNGYPWVANIRIKTLPIDTRSLSTTAPSKMLPPLSQTALQELEGLAESSEGELKAALEHLVARQKARHTK